MKVTGWYGRDVKPTHIGWYEVSNRDRGLVHWKHRLVGNKFRWWDGAQWLTEKNGDLSIMGRHHSHQWRGLAYQYAQHDDQFALAA